MFNIKKGNFMKSDEEQIKKAVESLGEQLKNDASQEKNVTQLADEFFKNGHMPKDLLNLSDQQVEGLYAQGYNFYQTGRYKDAVQVFRLLIMLNANEAKYILGLASCFHMMKEYKNAVDTYTICCVLDPENPIPYYHMSDCFVAMKDPYSTIIALEMAIKKAGNKPEFQMLKDRALLTIKHLQEEIKDTIKAEK
ncbi:hypothetical protein NEOC84_001924|nr:hypothetical protein [Neochlamydia sp. AcF84]